MIKLHELGKTVGTQHVLIDLSLDIAEGERVALLGLRGSGKSILLQVLAGYTRPSYGDASIAEFSLRTHRQKVKEHAGYAPREAPLWPELNVSQYLKTCLAFRGIAPQQLAQILQRYELEELAEHKISSLNRGLAQQLNLVQALLHDPRVLLLDDLFIDLDLLESIRLRSFLQTHAQNRTFLLATHDLTLASTLCERVILLDQGRLVFDGPIESTQKPEFIDEFFHAREVADGKMARPVAP